MMVRQQTFGKMLLLVALLIAATVQVNSVFACEMLDTTFVNDCCCGDEGAAQCVDSSCAQDVGLLTESCCDVSIKISVTDDSDRLLFAIAATANQSNVDPPPGISNNSNPALQPSRPLEDSLRDGNPRVLGSASNTYLITQRLRI